MGSRRPPIGGAPSRAASSSAYRPRTSTARRRATPPRQPPGRRAPLPRTRPPRPRPRFRSRQGRSPLGSPSLWISFARTLAGRGSLVPPREGALPARLDPARAVPGAQHETDDAADALPRDRAEGAAVGRALGRVADDEPLPLAERDRVRQAGAVRQDVDDLAGRAGDALHHLEAHPFGAFDHDDVAGA